MTTAGCGQSVCGWIHTAFGEASALAPVPLRLRGQAQFGRERSDAPFYLSGTAAHTPYCTHTHTGSMTSSYNLDFLPDMMVESRLLVPGDRM